MRVLVIGAGIAGLACARAVSGAGSPGQVRVSVLEKSRGLGGRAATRRRDGPAFDHGAPYFSATHPAFRDLVAQWSATGAVAVWSDGPRDQRYVGMPGMSGLAQPLARGLEIELERRALEIRGAPGQWQVRLDGGRVSDPADRLAIAIPAPQASALLGDLSDRFQQLRDVVMEPCWTVMAAWRTATASPSPADVSRIEGAGRPLALALRNSAKPERARDPGGEAFETWVLHAGADWSRAHLEAERSEVGDALLAAFATARGGDPGPPAHCAIHRWRYARTATPLGAEYLWDDGLGIGIAGDWCLGRTIEDAWTSGNALGQRILSRR